MRNRAFLLSCLLFVAGTAQGEGAQPAEPGADGQEPSAQTAQKHTFDIWELRVEGNTLLQRVIVERTVYPYVGPGKSIEDVEAARKALETAYRDHGYATVVVDIPEQQVSRGIVKLAVVEGKVDRVRVEGSRYFSLDRISSSVPALTEGQVPNVPAMQQQLAELNMASPDRTVTPIFRPGRTPGTVEVELRVKDELPLHGDFELNNRNSLNTSELRASAMLRYANLWQREHSASLMYQVAPQDTDDVQVIAGTYVVPMGHGNVFAAYLVNSKSDVATAGDLAVIGNGNIVGARFIKSLAPADSYFHNATFGIDYKDFEEDVVLVDSPGFNTPIDYVNFLTQYRGIWGNGAGSKVTGGLSANFGLRGLGNTEEEFENKRFQARPNYIYLGAFGEYLRDFRNGIQLQARLDGQLADSPLVSNEQYGIGGAESVRGYFESQALGDDGYTASLELRSPSYAKHIAHLRELRFLTFTDAGKLRVQDPLPGQADSYELYSAGVGFRLEAAKGFDASLDWAWPLRDATDVEQGDSRGHFRLHYGF